MYPQLMTLGQVMRGDRLFNSLYEFTLGKEEKNRAVCIKPLTSKDVAQFKKAIEAYYVVELYVSDLPIVFNLGFR